MICPGCGVAVMSKDSKQCGASCQCARSFRSASSNWNIACSGLSCRLANRSLLVNSQAMHVRADVDAEAGNKKGLDERVQKVRYVHRYEEPLCGFVHMETSRVSRRCGFINGAFVRRLAFSSGTRSGSLSLKEPASALKDRALAVQSPRRCQRAEGVVESGEELWDDGGGGGSGMNLCNNGRRKAR